ncbi:hypothetical protein V1523DRAFT_421801 [Lipomyces doorenjongii]
MVMSTSVEKAPFMTTFQAVVKESIKSSRIIRVRTGCITCKRRHLKCDEKKPICKRCSKAKIACVYHSSNYYFRTKSYSGSQVSPAGDEPEQEQEPQTDMIQKMQGELTGVGEYSGPTTAAEEVPVDFSIESSGPALINGKSDHITASDVDWHSNHSQSQGTPTSKVAISNHLKESSSDCEHHGTACQLQSYSAVNTCHVTGALIRISDDEYGLIQNFVKRIGPWFDLFDSENSFSTDVTRMGFYSPTIMKSILAISSKQLALTSTYDYKISVQYYDDTLKFVRQALANSNSVSASLEAVFIATVVLSVYEMLEPAAIDWQRHLKGAMSQAISLGVSSKSKGSLKTAFWSYARQDVANSMLSRNVLGFSPPLWQIDMTTWSSEPKWSVGVAANNAVYLWGLVTNYCAQQSNGYQDMTLGAEELEDCLALWRSRLDSTFEPLWVADGYEDGITRYFYYPPDAGLAIQIYYSAKLMLAVRKPPPKDVNIIQHCRKLKQSLASACDRIIGISLCCKDEPASLLSIHCLHAAGQVTDDPWKRKVVLRLLRDLQESCGWETRYIQQELIKDWDLSHDQDG